MQEKNTTEIEKSLQERRWWQIVAGRVVEVCRPTRTVVVGFLYLLTVLSILTTYAIWDFVDLNSAKGLFACELTV